MSALRERMHLPGELDTRAGKVFAPMRGMSVRVDTDGFEPWWWVVIGVDADGVQLDNGASTGDAPANDLTHIDTSDPATLGCMWAQVEARYPEVMMERRGTDWNIIDIHGRRIATGRTPAHAMVAAMAERRPGL